MNTKEMDNETALNIKEIVNFIIDITGKYKDTNLVSAHLSMIVW